MLRFEFESKTISVFTFVFVHMENRVCLSRSVQVAAAAWWAVMRIVLGVGDLVQRTGYGHTSRVLGGRTIRRLGDAVCDLHCAQGDDEHEFLG
jgi:hypothetical protein